jgi:hypothetical protein
MTRIRRTGRWVAAVAGLLVASHAGDCPAHGPDDTTELIIIAVTAAILPAETGMAVPADGSGPRFVLGWSWQLPFNVLIGEGSFRERTFRHRVVAGVDWLPHPENAWRGRVGYRYGRRHVFGGAGVGVSGAGASLSPELGVKFLHAGDDEGPDLSWHLLARIDLAADSGHVRGATILVGWNVF